MGMDICQEKSRDSPSEGRRSVYRAITWSDRTNGPYRQSRRQGERIIVEELPHTARRPAINPLLRYRERSEEETDALVSGHGDQLQRGSTGAPRACGATRTPSRTCPWMPMGDGPASHDSVIQAVVQTLSHIVGDRKRSRPNLSRANEHQPSMTEAPSRKSAPEPAPLQVALDQWLRLARGLDAREVTREPVVLDARLRPGTGGSAPPDLEERRQQAEPDIRPKPPTTQRAQGSRHRCQR